MKSRSTCFGLGVVVMFTGLCSCSGTMGTVVDADGIDFNMFQDPDSEFSTSDVMDIDGEIVRFDAANQQMIWAADSTAFDGWDIDGNALAGGFFTVRFGTENGVRGAYFTETSPPTICDIAVTDGSLRISPTTTTVPQE